MERNHLSLLGAIVMSFMLVILLYITLYTNVNAQGCGINFPSGGAQDGMYASGGNAKYVPTSITDTMHLSTNWNLVSVPYRVEEFSKNILFPTAISSAFWFQGYYSVKDTLENGKGYWLKFPSEQTVPITGYELTTVMVPVDEGWNMIGSISEPLPVIKITSEPSGIITSQVFGYSGTYQGYDTLIPGKGFWIKTASAGMLILSNDVSVSMLAKNAIKIVRTDELPPPPPDGSVSSNPDIPKEYALGQAYPNPFNPSTRIDYQLPADSRVTLKVYNVLGQVTGILKDEIESAGYKSVVWNASSAASGIYFYRLDATNLSDPGKSFTQVKKVLLLK